MDKILDLAIALETLYGVGDRLSLYAAHFVGKESDDRLDCYEAVEEMRALRGRIVHKGHADTPLALVNRIEEITRLSINGFLQSGTGYERVVQQIKNAIIVGGLKPEFVLRL